jgi:ubiquinone/menaquinone biosynthesis C-methylase UbiE
VKGEENEIEFNDLVHNRAMTGHDAHYWSNVARIYLSDQEYIVGKEILGAITERLYGEGELGDVLEFCCGSGYFTKAIAKNARQVIATDHSDEMLDMARIHLQGFQNITTQKADCEDTSFPSERFDTVFIANLIHVAENPLRVLQESHQILKDKGLLLVVDFTVYGMNWFEWMKMAVRYLRKWGMPPRHGRSRLSPEQLVSLVEEVGFSTEEVELIGERTKAIYLRGRK